MKFTNKQIPVLVTFGVAFILVGAAGMWLYQDVVARFFGKEQQQGQQTTQTDKKTLSPTKVAVLEYHVIRDINSEQKSVYDDVTVTTDAFFYQMEYLANNGYTTLTFQDLEYHFSNNIPLPKKPVVITFDDGHVTVLNNAQSTLKKFKLNAVVFVVTDYINQSGYLSDDAITQLIRAGNIEIGSHTMKKVRLADVPREEMERDLRLSKEALEKKFPIKVISFSYPFANFSDGVASYSKLAGYKYGVLSDEKVAVFPFENPVKVSRIRITKEMSQNDFVRLLEPLR